MSCHRVEDSTGAASSIVVQSYSDRSFLLKSGVESFICLKEGLKPYIFFQSGSGASRSPSPAQALTRAWLWKTGHRGLSCESSRPKTLKVNRKKNFFCFTFLKQKNENGALAGKLALPGVMSSRAKPSMPSQGASGTRESQARIHPHFTTTAVRISLCFAILEMPAPVLYDNP